MIIFGVCWFKLHIITILSVSLNFICIYIYLIYINFKLYIIPLSYIGFKFLSVIAVVENRQDLQECFSFRVMGGSL